MEEKISKLLEERLKIPARGLTLTQLHGDATHENASNRIYYRVKLADERSWIVMKLPAGKSSVSEEITNLKAKPAELPFVAIDRYLKELDLPVPEILLYEEKEGVLILEDLGDMTLEKKIRGLPESDVEDWYRSSIDLLIQFQKKTGEGSRCLAHQRSFDATLLNWEFDHFFEYGIEARLGIRIPHEDLESMRRHASQITEFLAGLPQVLVHRDFQSRNLMVQDGGLRLLDFQDALMGPMPYDLVALLRDSYIKLSSGSVSRLMDYFLDNEKIETREFQKMFDWMTIQRKLKDAGRFVYIDRVKGNPSFLKHIPNSLTYVREAFERQPELERFFEILKKYVPEFN